MLLNCEWQYPKSYLCPECGGKIVLAGGEFACENCGLVDQDRYICDAMDFEAPFVPKNSSKSLKLHRFPARVYERWHQNKMHDFWKMGAARCQYNSLYPEYEVKWKVMQQYIKLVHDSLRPKRQYTYNGLLALSLYFYVCRYNLPITIREIEQPAGICLYKYFRAISLKIPRIPLYKRVEVFVIRFLSDFCGTFPDQVLKILPQFIQIIKRNPFEFGGSNPVGIAVAIIYLLRLYDGTFLKHLTQSQIAETVHVSEVTLRMNCRRFKKTKKLPPKKPTSLITVI